MNEELIPATRERIEAALLPGYSAGVNLASTVRLQRLEAHLTSIVATAVGSASTELRNALRVIVVQEAQWLDATFDRVYPFKVDFSAPSTRQLLHLVDDRTMAGRLLEDWWSKVEVNARDAIKLRINQGLLSGESTAGIVRSVIGTRAQGGLDGVLNIPRRDAERVVRTAVQTVTNAARSETYKENSDIVKHEIWSAFFDVKTCQVCANLHGTIIVGNRVPPEHPLCRCVTEPVLKSFNEMGWNLSDPPELSRAAKQYDDAGKAMVVMIPETTTFAQWFAKQPASIQREWLGPRVYERYRKGEISIKDLTDVRFRARSVKEVMALK